MVPVFLPVLEMAGAAEPADVAAEVAPAPPAGPPPHDSMFPGGGRLSMSLASGVPFVAIGELAIGIGDRFAFGVLGGTTPDVPGFGVRPRVSIFDTGRVRGVLSAPSLYYPFTADGGAGWVLTRPSFVVEHAWPSGVRLGGGLGMAAATVVEHRRLSYGEKNITSGVWNTVNATFAAPVASHTSVFAEAAVVFDGFRLATDNWVGVVPFTFSAGVATTLL